MLVDLQLWISIEEGPFIPQKVIDGYQLRNHRTNGMEMRLKRRFMIWNRGLYSPNTYSLSVNVYFSISYCKMAKVMSNTLYVFHERSEDVKQFKINILIVKYELLCMELGECVASMEISFSHINNKLENLGKSTSNQDYTNKILRSMCME